MKLCFLFKSVLLFIVYRIVFQISSKITFGFIFQSSFTELTSGYFSDSVPDQDSNLFSVSLHNIYLIRDLNKSSIIEVFISTLNGGCSTL